MNHPQSRFRHLSPWIVAGLAFCCLAAPSLSLAQTPPTLSSVPDQGVHPNATNRLIAIVIDDAETPPTQLTLTGASSDTNIVPNSGLILGGSSNNRTLSIVPAANQTGAVSITLTVTDKSGLSTSNSFALDVNYFTPVTNGLPALMFSQAAWGDYDNDGDLDVVVAGDDTNATVCRIYRNDNATFTDLNAGLAAVNRSGLGWADYDNDGFLDLLITGGSTHLYHNNGNGTFTEIFPGFPSVSVGAFAWGDMDNDGDLDLLLAGDGAAGQIWRNHGGGNFSLLGLPSTGGSYLNFASAAWGDYDHDGDLDFLVSGYVGNNTAVTKLYRNDTQGVFTEQPAGLPGVYGSTTAWGDYDHDGDPDLLLCGRDNSGASLSRIYHNDSGTFVNLNAGLAGGWLGRGSWGDVDNDGFLDAVVAGRDGSTKLYRNNRNQTFSEVPFNLAALDEGVTAFADYDRDGDLDLLLIGDGCFSGCALTQLYRNNAPTNAPPAAPAGLNITLLPGNDVSLRWNASTDALTASNGLTYNLRVGTNSGGIEISSPQSDLATGWRRVPQSGSAHTNRWKLVDLAKGTYYWSVQAVDPGFAGSPFSTQGTFTITNSRPVISQMTNLLVAPGASSGPVSFMISDAETPADNLVLSVVSSNPNLAPTNGIIFGGSGTNRNITLSTTPFQYGDSTITITVTDSGGLTRSSSFVLQVESFQSSSAGLPQLCYARAAWGDMDGDGDLDLALAGSTNYDGSSPMIQVYRNDGAAGFTNLNLGLPSVYAFDLQWADIDGDGDLDLLLVGIFGENVTRIFQNDGSGHLAKTPSTLPSLAPTRLTLADLDSDGDLDAIFTSVDLTTYCRVYRNDGNSQYIEMPGVLPDLMAPGVAVGDYDNDGDLDLALSGGGQSRLYRNDGGFRFTSIDAGFSGTLYGLLAWGDYDRDGWLDLALSGSYLTTVKIYHNNHNGTFAELATLLPAGWLGSLAWGDYDNDGWLDLGCAGVKPMAIARNNHDGTFSMMTTNLPTFGDYYRSTAMVWGDYDNDGDLDCCVAGNDGTTPVSRIYRNLCAVSNAPPSGPAAPLATIISNRVELSWSPAADPQTPGAPLTYNLRLGTSPGANDIAPSHARPDGKRLLAAPGNLGPTNRWQLVDLLPGTYYWSVQAVDTVLAGSALADGGSFAVTKTRPKVSAVATQMAAPGFPSIPAAFTVFDYETDASNLVMTATSADTNLIPLSNIFFEGTGSNSTISVLPNGGTRGTNLITMTVTDSDGFIDSTSFQVVINPFVTLTNLNVGGGGQICWGDYNNDNLLDFVVAGGGAGTVYRNLDGNLFTNDASGLPGGSQSKAAWGDYDNDGDLDLVFCEPGRLYRNDGTNHFTLLGTSFSNLSRCAVAWGDYDNDGRLDLLFTGGNTTQLYRSLGGGAFTNVPVSFIGTSQGAAAWGDLDNDGDADLVISGALGVGSGNNRTYVYRNDGAGAFTLLATNLAEVFYSSLSLGDYNADGFLDIFVAGYTRYYLAAGIDCRIHRNLGGTNFFSEVFFPTNSALAGQWGDYDNDGDLDLLLAGTGPTTAFLNQSNAAFLDAQLNLPGVSGDQSSWTAMAWADGDRDGDLDVLSGQLSVNLRGLSNQPPQAPSVLTSQVVSNRVWFSWSRAQDSATSIAGLSYNLRVGSQPGTGNIVSANADPLSGLRRVVAWGNGGLTTNYWIQTTGLPDGNYFWSVQAIDSGYAGSPFTAEASFTYFHPTVSVPSNVVKYAAAPSVVVPLLVNDADSDPATLTLSAFSSNTNFLNVINLLFSGSGSNRTVTITLPPDSVGTSMVSVVVADITGLTGTNVFRFESSYFSDVTPVFSGGNYYNAHWADFDNDNDLDVFYGGFVYRNDGSNNFALVVSPGAANRNGVVWGDYDRDGDQDFAWTDGATLKIFRNDGGVFVNTGQNIALGGTAALAWGDYDNDGDLDLAVTQPSASRLYRNDAGMLTLAGASLPACQDGAVAWGDFDNDGDLDLLMAGLGYGSTDWHAEVFRNDGGGVFTAIGAGLFGTDHSSVAWGDIDNDGLLDALVTGFNYGSYVLKVYHNNGNGTFTDLNLPLQGVAYSDAGFGDFDNDGWLDIHLNGCKENYCATSLMAIYRNNHDGTFSDLNAGLPPTTAGQVGVGDYDNDGDLDLLADKLYRNNCLISNTPPAMPLSPVAQLLADNAVRLTWLVSIDLETTNAAGLSYDVRVGTAPGGSDYASPGADLANGYRRVPQRGAQNTNFCVLRDVPKGTYYWSVQAVDPAFAGSTFSAEGTFTITNTRPIISTITNQITVPGRATPPIAFTIFDEETPAENLLVTAISTNTALVPNGNIAFHGSGSNRTATVTPAGSLSGSTAIIISVMDAQGLVATSRFDVVVQTFTEVNAGIPSSTTVATAWGDYDNDGDLDIAQAGTQYGYTTIHRNTNGLFTNQNFTLPATGYYLTPTDLAWIDFDNDGDLDLTQSGWLSSSSGYTTATLRLRNNTPTNTFTGISTNLPGIGVANIADGAMAWADYDNDGDLDVLLSGDTNTYHTPDAFTALYRNDRGVFTNSGVVLPALVRGAAAWGDYDHDGDLDLMLAGQTGSVATNSVTRLFWNNGNGTFTDTGASFPGVTDCALAFGDFDNDGDLDVALAGTGTNAAPLTRIYRNIGGSVFTNLTATLVNVTYPSISWGDYDNDGFADLLVGGSTSTVPYYNANVATANVYRNLGGTGFTNTGSALPGVMMQNVSWGDYDNDGDLDVLSGTRLARNNWNIPNTPPTTPTNLSFLLLSNNTAQFTWSPASDLETTNPRGLSYNLRLGTNSGGNQIVSAMSAPGNGYRRVPQFGNAGPTNSWSIFILTNGTYYWSVQAVDPGLAGSAFATEGTFTLSRPVFSAITNRSVAPNTVVGPIAFTVSDAETAGSNLLLSAWSSDTNLVANEKLVLAGTGISRTLTVTPNTNRSGTVTIMIVATDENNESGSVSFQITYERFADINAGLSALVGQVAWGDYDNDGDLDLMRGPHLYRNDGGGLFTQLSPLGLPTGPVTVAFGDCDNDNDLDLLMHGNAFGIVAINSGTDSFTVATNIGGNPSSSLAWGDYDNDGDQDFLRAYSNATQLYRNNGSNSFTLISTGLPIAYPGSVAWCDYDKDGDLDILMAGSGLTRIYVNNGNDTFTSLAITLPVMYNASVAWGDFDSDGWMDFAVAGATNNIVNAVATRIYRNVLLPGSGSRTFTNVPAPQLQGIWKGAVAWGDYDNDGDLDLLVTGEILNINAARFAQLYRNDNGVFADSGHAFPVFYNPFVAWGDYNNDGQLDLAISGNGATGAPFSRIYRNYANGVTNPPPSAPLNLTNVVFRKSARLSWGKGSDANQSAPLTYNLRVGTAPGAGNIFNPMSLTNGQRKLPAFGNTQERQSWTLTNLIGGTFYWSVQAVDHSFAGSTFSAEGSFFVTNLPPVAAAKSAALNEDASVGLTFTGSDPDSDPLTYNVATQPLFGTLSGTPPNVTYTPRPDYFGLDLFTYRANDRTTDSVPAQVAIQINPVTDNTNISLAIQPQAGGQMQLSLTAEAWSKYTLQASTDLIHWLTLTNVTTTNQLWQVMDADAALYPQRFYRAGLLPFENSFEAGQFYDAQGFHFSLIGETGRVYQVHFSTDLIHWIPLTTLLLTNTPLPLVDPTASQSPYRFYRLLGP